MGDGHLKYGSDGHLMYNASGHLVNDCGGTTGFGRGYIVTLSGILINCCLFGIYDRAIMDEVDGLTLYIPSDSASSVSGTGARDGRFLWESTFDFQGYDDAGCLTPSAPSILTPIVGGKGGIQVAVTETSPPTTLLVNFRSEDSRSASQLLYNATVAALTTVNQVVANGIPPCTNVFGGPGYGGGGTMTIRAVCGIVTASTPASYSFSNASNSGSIAFTVGAAPNGNSEWVAGVRTFANPSIVMWVVSGPRVDDPAGEVCFATITSAMAGAGNTTLTFTVPANTTGVARSCYIVVNGWRVPISQAA